MDSDGKSPKDGRQGALVVVDPDQGTVGKFASLEVPNYSKRAGHETDLAYLRLGAADPFEYAIDDPLEKAKEWSWGRAPLGTDLALKAVIQGLDVKGRGGNIEEGDYTLFEDDERDHGPQKHILPESERKQRTADFFKDIGWRDHCDGNRLSTTRGDKVEVIGGNYKLVVLGRQSEPIAGTGFDMSGGDTRALSCVDAEVDSTEVNWDSEDDCWRVTEKVHAGKVYGYFRGRLRHEETGRAGGDDEENPEIIEKTWAKKIESTTAVEAGIIEAVAAGNIVSTVVAATITEGTEAGNIVETTTAAAIEEITNVAGIINEVVNAGVINEQTNVIGALNENVNAGMINGVTNAATAINEMKSAPVMTEQTIVPGAKLENVNAGTIVSLTTAATVAEVSVVGQTKLDVLAASASYEITLASKIDLLIGMVMDLVVGLRIDGVAGKKIDLNEEKQEINLDQEHTATEIKINGTTVKIGIAP